MREFMIKKESTKAGEYVFVSLSTGNVFSEKKGAFAVGTTVVVRSTSSEDDYNEVKQLNDRLRGIVSRGSNTTSSVPAVE